MATAVLHANYDTLKEVCGPSNSSYGRGYNQGDFRPRYERDYRYNEREGDGGD